MKTNLLPIDKPSICWRLVKHDDAAAPTAPAPPARPSPAPPPPPPPPPLYGFRKRARHVIHSQQAVRYVAEVPGRFELVGFMQRREL